MSTHHILELKPVPRVRLNAVESGVSWNQNVVRLFVAYLPWA